MKLSLPEEGIYAGNTSTIVAWRTAWQFLILCCMCVVLRADLELYIPVIYVHSLGYLHMYMGNLTIPVWLQDKYTLPPFPWFIFIFVIWLCSFWTQLSITANCIPPFLSELRCSVEKDPWTVGDQEPRYLCSIVRSAYSWNFNASYLESCAITIGNFHHRYLHARYEAK